MNQTREPLLIALQADLDALVARLEPATLIALDTEFVRESTYYARLCLLQIGTDDLLACVDPLNGLDLGALWERLLAPGTTLLMHSARQDLELVLAHAGRLPAALLDTQVAAGLLGHPPQVGYAGLVERLIGVALAKGHTRTDWSRRPLDAAQLEYAIDDVRYLPEAWRRLEAGLVETGRLAWAHEESAALLDPTLYENPPELAWQRVKGLRRLQGDAREAARALAAWRERTAEQFDRPRQWVLSDAQLLAIAGARPRDTAALANVAGLPPGLVRRRGRELVEAANSSVAGDPIVDPPPPDDRDRALLKRLGECLKKRAEALGVDPQVLATRADLVALVRGDGHCRLLTGWRREAAGAALLDAKDS